MQRHTNITFSYYITQLLDHKKTFFAAICCVCTAVVAGLIAPLYYKDFFDIISTAENPAQEVTKLHGLVFVILGFHAIGWVSWRIAAFCAAYFQTESMKHLSARSFEYIHKHASVFFNNTFVGSLVKKVNRFGTSFESVTDIILWEFLPLLIEITVISVYLSYSRPLFGGIVCVWLVLFCVCNIVFLRYKVQFDEAQAKLDSKATGILADSFTNHENITLFSACVREKQYYTATQDTVYSLRRKRWNLDTWFDVVQYFLTIVVECAIFYYGVNYWVKGVLSLGDLVLIQTYLFMIFRKMGSFSRVMRWWYEALANAKEMAEIFDTPHTIIDRAGAQSLAEVHGDVSLDNVCFTYEDGKSILNNFTLNIPAGQKVGLVGPSGAGKSTVIKLLLRLFDATGGVVQIDGQDVSSITQNSLHDCMSLVPQDPILFHRSIIENIRYGKPEATDDEVVEAAKAAHCHEFITGLSDGYTTLVGERGVKLSGGERQRVAIARAILRDAPILLLDEATSALDSESEMLIQRALETVLVQGKTVIAIAHRLSSISSMDRIIVMESGGIVEDGSHHELLSNTDGLYSQLWNIQVGGFAHQEW